MAKFVVFGANGVLGKTLVADLKASNQEVMSVVRGDINIFNAGELRDFLSTCGEAIFVNCVAFMPADKCESDPALSQKVNVDFVETLAVGIAMNKKQRLIHFSSDFVFDGESKVPYLENSKPKPLNVYGEHKYESEEIVAETLDSQSRIIRFASLVSHSTERKTFLEKVIDRAKTTGQASVVDDLTISTATSELVARAVEFSFRIEKPIIHAVHNGSTSWFELAKIALAAVGYEGKIEAVKSSAFPTTARRPQFSALQPSPEIQELDPRPWHEAVANYAGTYLV
jgi:dTDP-4-dehydrorhamnose reductase